jgi:O-antigen ligase
VPFLGPVRPQRYRLLVSLALLNAGWVFLSGSRGSALISGACLLFILIRLRPSKGVLVTVAVATLTAVAAVNQFEALESRAAFRVTKLFDTDYSGSDRTSGRSDLARGGWQMFLEHPLGIGTGGFPHGWALFSNRSRAWAFGGAHKEAHSAWIKVLVENGVPGICLFAAFVLSFAFVGWTRRTGGQLLSGVFVTGLLSMAFVVDEFQGKGLWFLAGAGMVCLGAGRHRRLASEKPTAA